MVLVWGLRDISNCFLIYQALSTHGISNSYSIISNRVRWVNWYVINALTDCDYNRTSKIMWNDVNELLEN